MKLKMILVLIFLGSTVFGQSLFPFKDEWTGNFGYKDQKGTIVVKAEFEKVNPFFDGVAIVEDGYYHQQYVLANGQFIPLKQKISMLNNFSDGIGLVEAANGYSFYIDKTGKVISKNYRQAYPFSEGLAIVIIDNTLTIIDKSFNRLFDLPVEPSSDEEKYATEFSGGMLALQNSEGKWGFIDNTGKLVIKPAFSVSSDFVGDYSFTQISGAKNSNEWVVINKKGETVYTVETSRYDYPSDHVAFYKDFFVWNPDRGEIIIVDLKKGSKVKVDVPQYMGGYNYPLLYMWGDNILYDSSLISLSGKILIQYKKDFNVIWNDKYLSFGKDKQLFDINGNEFPKQN